MINAQITAEEKVSRILSLKEEKDVLLLAHYYQPVAIQKLADFCGDSFELAKRAKASKASNIVFCGVKFMAESTKILNPQKKVFLPAVNAGCAMADMITPAVLAQLKEAHPKAAVVCYINSSAATKALADICCTSSNAIDIVRSLPNEEIIFVPDKNLGAYVAEHIPEKKFIFYEGWCPIHKNVSAADAKAVKEEFPEGVLVVHPECEKEVIKYADFAGSTSAILDYCRKCDARTIIVGTESSIAELLHEEFPEKNIYLLSPHLLCIDMKKTNFDNLLETMESIGKPDCEKEVIMSEGQIKSALLPLERMLNAGV